MTDEVTFLFDGSRFSDIEGFYDEVSREMMGGIYEGEQPRMPTLTLDSTYWGRNRDAFSDLLTGGMGRVPHGPLANQTENFTIVWRNSELSTERLGPFFDEIVEIIRDHRHVSLRLE